MSLYRLAIICTHPIQYYTPVFKLLAQSLAIRVFYTIGAQRSGNYDAGFGKKIEWDIPLLEGYDYEWVINTAKNPGSHYRKGIVNVDLNEKIAEFKPDAILIYGWNYDSHWKAMRYFKGKIPIWFRGDSTLLDKQGNIKSWIKKIYLTWVYKHIDKAFYVGTANKAYFKHYGLKEDQLVFAPHAIDNDRFAEDRSSEASALRESLGIDKDDLLILFAGKLEPKKDPMLLLDAFIQLHATESTTMNQELKHKIHLLFVGNGVLENQLTAKAEDFNQKIASSFAMTKRIHFKPFQNQSQMPVVYQACNLFCLPSLGPGETWGLAVNEAMAAGKAILISDKVGCAKDLVDSQNGCIFNASELKDLCCKLEMMLSQDSVEMGSASKIKIDHWSMERQVGLIKHSIDPHV